MIEDSNGRHAELARVMDLRECTMWVLMWSSNRLITLARCPFISRMSCSNSFWMFFMALIQASNRSPILIPRKQIWEKVFHLISCYAYDTYMHDMKSMKWRVVHKRFNRSWFITKTCTNKNLEEKKREKQHLNVIRFFLFFIFFQISTFGQVALSQLSFIQTNV